MEQSLEKGNIEVSTELKSHFLRLYQIALSDENFSHLEMQLLYQFAAERGVDNNELDRILTSHTGEIHIPEKLEDRMVYLYDFAQMAWADHVITEDERTTLKKYVKKFEFLDENVEALTTYLLESAQQEKSREDILKELQE
ncbi:hypothetical protein RQM59_06535 [Flavobacteriaceae bacterium S356]|uniref:Co-chaperone DjlA N-terminal domain-containing protein n=1 Tax=Asprobacillus argus TaxID=3076534 RepID=A0ABU3LFR6_9FLAO|nr:hypothetical protein [Flavobacteriaceae bacterium S356]